MSTEIAKREDVEIITADKILSYMNAFGIASQLNDGEKSQFIEVATAYNLNPFKREIYCVPYDANVKKPDGTWGKERKLSIITGYEVYLKRAERVGSLDGWEVAIEGSGDNMKAVLTIYRKDWSRPFKHEVYFDETAKKDSSGNLLSMWKTMPKFMLKKVAIAQGFRMAFPDEFGGMPYTSDELPDNMTTGFNAEPKNVTSESSATRVEQSKTDTSSEAPKNEKSAPSEERTLSEGEVLDKDHWFWKISSAERSQYIPDGCKYSKVNGSWIVTKAA